MSSKLINLINLENITNSPKDYSFVKFSLIYADLNSQLNLGVPSVVSVSSLISCISVATDDIKPHLIGIKDAIFTRFTSIENFLIVPVKKTVRTQPDKSKILVEVRHLTDAQKKVYDNIAKLVRIDRELTQTEAEQEFKI